MEQREPQKKYKHTYTVRQLCGGDSRLEDIAKEFAVSDINVSSALNTINEHMILTDGAINSVAFEEPNEHAGRDKVSHCNISFVLNNISTLFILHNVSGHMCLVMNGKYCPFNKLDGYRTPNDVLFVTMAGNIQKMLKAKSVLIAVNETKKRTKATLTYHSLYVCTDDDIKGLCKKAAEEQQVTTVDNTEDTESRMDAGDVNDEAGEKTV